MRIAIAFAVVIAVPLVSGGCFSTTGSGPTQASHLPTNYRQMIVKSVKKSFKDPDSVRDAGISQPFPKSTFLGPVMVVCVMSNAKNSFGGYTGRTPMYYQFRNGALQLSDDEYAEAICAGATYEPFPEIEGKQQRS